ncbi:MAG TPA: hypothetical protein PLD37_11885 [Usitatibacteraceae bacterium]|nr:hypothetical protein [Usitatibacteraceae bacterium]
MSNVLNFLMSRGGLFRAAFLGAALGFSVAAHAAVGDAPAAPFNVGDSAVQAQTFDALAGFAAVPLSAAEAESVDGARFKWRLPKRWPLPKPRPCAPGGRLPSLCI